METNLTPVLCAAGFPLRIATPLIYEDVTRVRLLVCTVQVLHYGNTTFGTKDSLCMLLKRYVIFAIHSPKLEPAKSMLIEGICYYSGC